MVKCTLRNRRTIRLFLCQIVFSSFYRYHRNHTHTHTHIYIYVYIIVYHTYWNNRKINISMLKYYTTTQIILYSNVQMYVVCRPQHHSTTVSTVYALGKHQIYYATANARVFLKYTTKYHCAHSGPISS
jgi:hypothetical protein